jgi:hypothetical protein
MPASSDEARALAAQVQPGRPRPELTGRIAACGCGEGARAGLFLLNGDWERAHEVAQSMDGPLGAHWHALVHRHEPDYANSKYWLRQAGASPVHRRLAEAARAAGQEARVAPGGAWDALAFTDCYADPAQDAWTRPLDALEQRALLEHCLETGA